MFQKLVDPFCLPGSSLPLTPFSPVGVVADAFFLNAADRMIPHVHSCQEGEAPRPHGATSGGVILGFVLMRLLDHTFS
jgi:hypothetical protein